MLFVFIMLFKFSASVANFNFGHFYEWSDIHIKALLCTCFCSLVGSFSVLLVSIVKWRHLRDQVSPDADDEPPCCVFHLVRNGKKSVQFCSEGTFFFFSFQALLLVQLTLADLLAAAILMFTSVMNKIGTSSELMCHYSLPLSLVRICICLELNSYCYM